MVWKESASHVPVLTLLPQLFCIKRILEIGSGELSTKLFLDKTIYSDLKELVTVEEDEKWMVKTKKMVAGDSRINLLSSVPAYYHNYDLIFLDGPQDAIRRAKVIRYFMKEGIKPLVAIHDIENKGYKKQVNNKEFNSYLFNFIPRPMTGVYSIEQLPLVKFKKSNNIMRKHFDDLQEDWIKWKEIL